MIAWNLTLWLGFDIVWDHGGVCVAKTDCSDLLHSCA